MPTLPEGSIRVEHVWKRFRADRARPRLYDQMVRLRRQVRRRGSAEWRWVLREVNLAVDPGETVALVGVNGSGKSTLLKIISRVTYQTTGRSEASGRIGALLEVRSGIHPELSGRENVFLYGAILGLTRRKIAARFDDIVDFAEVNDAIDRQIKYYSSGMQIRLGFAIAAFLEPAILLVDEVLAVGDASFQQKCLARISEVVRNGTTLVFVSHDLAAVEAMCDRSVWLADAVVRAEGPTRDVLGLYRSAIEERAALTVPSGGGTSVVKAEVSGPNGGQVVSGQSLEINLVVRNPRSGDADLFVGVSEGTAMPIFVTRRTIAFSEGDLNVRCTLRHLPLPQGKYYLWVGMARGNHQNFRQLLTWQPLVPFDVFGPRLHRPPKGVMVLSPVHVDSDWDIDHTA